MAKKKCARCLYNRQQGWKDWKINTATLYVEGQIVVQTRKGDQLRQYKAHICQFHYDKFCKNGDGAFYLVRKLENT